MLIYLIRHGATACNEERRYQGITDVPLSQAGRETLRQADFCPETVCVSPLFRARETAAILFPAAKQIVVSGFREMDFGAFEGRTAAEMEDDPAYRAWVEDGCTGRCPGGESLAEFSCRVWDAFVPLLAAETERLVIVAHGGVQMAILERYARPRRDYFDWHAPCGGGFVLDGQTLMGEVRYGDETSMGRAGRLLPGPAAGRPGLDAPPGGVHGPVH